MSSWSMGYQADHLYTYGYYGEMNPLKAKFLFNHSGLAFPDMSSGYACELGFGQGVSINMHAVASNTTWYGTDFNPSQVNFARHLTQKIGANVHLYEEAFGDFAKRDDLPQFDYITLHGIWSWISRENQGYIVDFIKKNLKVGGVVYISYNVSPGFITFEPVRQLMAEFNECLVAPKMDPDSKVKAIREYLERLIQVNPAVLQNNPTLAARIRDTLTKDSHYLFAEYFNQSWDIIHFSDMVAALDHAKLNYACSATGTEHLDNINLTPQQQQLLASLRGTPLFESTRDFIVNQQFRRDFFVRGPMQLTPAQKDAELRATHFILAVPSEDFSYQVNTRLGKASLKQEVYEPIVKFFSDYQPHSLGEALDSLTSGDNKLNAPQVAEAICTLALLGTLSPAKPLADIKDEVKERCQKLNADFISGLELAQINCLASPVTQGAIYVNDVNRKLLSKYQQEPSISEEALLDYICAELQRTGANLNQKGRAVTDANEQREILKGFVHTFYQHCVPLYRGLQLI